MYKPAQTSPLFTAYMFVVFHSAYAKKSKEQKTTVKKSSSLSVAEAFNQSSDEEEEMPPEAKMRMRNIGRDTPTSAGPNSFGKTRKGFCDIKKVFERDLKSKMNEVAD
ncbi:hypothetical protein MTO96_008473 [Rhipicephalus appendiculatus]